MNLEGYYINLEADRERRRTMEAQLDKLGLSGVVKRFPAVAGSDMAAPAGSPLSPAEAGCWMSHWRILQQASADRHLLVLEDDVILHRLAPAFLEVVDGLQDPWDLFYLEALITPSFLFHREATRLLQEWRNDPTRIDALDLQALDYSGATAYLIHRDSLPKVRRLLEAEDQARYPFDLTLRKFVHGKHLIGRITIPYLAQVANLDQTTNLRSPSDTARVLNIYREYLSGETDPKDLVRRVRRLSRDIQVREVDTLFLEVQKFLISDRFQLF